MTLVRKLPAKKLTVRRRVHALDALTRIRCSKLRNTIAVASRVLHGFRLQRIGSIHDHREARLVSFMRSFIILHLRLTTVQREALHAHLPKIESKQVTIDSIPENDIPQQFRFKSKDQLYRLLRGFQFPDVMYGPSGHKFSGEEVMLLGLYRLHFPSYYNHFSYKELFGFDNQRASLAFKLFLRHISLNWGYLLLDNMQFWKPYIPQCAEAIRQKLLREPYNCYFEPPGQEAGFNIFGFIDNTMNATCRPGGGPTRDGTNAPRNDPLIQRAWYNGWKKVHGMKWQTIDLPNGMNFHVYGPVSLRHNDLYTLHHSQIDQKLDELFAGDVYRYAIYGDSAYLIYGLNNIRARHDNLHNTPREVLENKSMSSCRECIEWDYGDVGKMWAFVDYKKILKLRRMAVGPMYLVALILRNAHNTMNGCNTCEFFAMAPPSFEEWTSQGPREIQLHEDVAVVM